MRALVTATVRLLRASAAGGPPPQSSSPDDLPAEGAELEELPRSGPIHGIWLAVATFVPTFLATLLGIAYLAGLPMGTGIVGDLKAGPGPGMSAPTFQRESVTTARQTEAPTREALGSAAGPATSRANSRPVPRPAHPQVKLKAAEPKRSASTVTTDAAWVRGGAFPDRGSADRLAASVERRGYPAKVRREDTSWVVWIWTNPSGAAPSERRK